MPVCGCSHTDEQHDTDDERWPCNICPCEGFFISFGPPVVVFQ